MKQHTYNGYAEKLKISMERATRKSKETIRNIVDSSSKQIESALDANKDFIESLENQFFTSDHLDGSLVSEVKRNFGNSVELSEETIDTILDIQSGQLKSTIEFNEKLAVAIRNLDGTDNEGTEELLGSIEEHIEESSNQSIENTKKMTDIYNKHVNLVVNFNDRFSKNVNNQLRMLNRFQSKNKERFNDWAADWWRSTSKEEEMA